MKDLRIGIFFGSSLGNTQFVADKIALRIPKATCLPVNNLSSKDIEQFDLLILGTSTWGIGDLQDDFELFVDQLLTADLSSKTFAIFGLGDQGTYPDSFCNGMGKLYKLLTEKSYRIIGNWPTEGYDFSESEAVIDDHFVGLALDEDNEPDLTDTRIDQWVEILKNKLA